MSPLRRAHGRFERVTVVTVAVVLLVGACKSRHPDATPPVSEPAPKPPPPGCDCQGLRVVDLPFALEDVPLEPPPGWGVCRFCRRDCSVALASTEPAGEAPWPPPIRLTSRADDETSTEVNFEVDPHGLVIAKRSTTWRRTYAYDDAGRLAFETFHQDDDGEEWDEAFQYVETPLDGGVLRETFHRVADGGWSLDGTSQTWIERAGRRVRTVSATGESVTEYDDERRVVKLASPVGALSFSYDSAGRLEARRSPSGVTTFSYDDAGTRVREVERAAITTWRIAADGLPTQRLEAALSRTTEFRYDEHRHLKERVTSGKEGSVALSFEYDEAQLTRWSDTAPWCVRR